MLPKRPCKNKFNLGGLVQFVVAVNNVGTVAAPNVTLTDVLPITGSNWTIDAPAPAGCAIAEGVLTCDFGTLDAAASRSVHISAVAGAGSCGLVSNTASVSAADEPVGSQDDNDASATVMVNCLTGVNVAITKTTPNPVVYQGEPLVFTMVASNVGEEIAQSVVLVDPLPAVAGLSWSIVEPVQGCAIAANTLTCNFGNLASGEARTVKITSPTNSTAGQIQNTASVSAANETAGNEGDNNASAQAQVPVAACLNLNLFGGKYTNGFEQSFPGQIGIQGYNQSVAPRGQTFLGEYGNQTVPLTVGCLPEHNSLLISFDLYVIRSWDGNATISGPDHWKLELQGRATPLMDTTFSNWSWSRQAYPGSFSTGDYSYQTGAAALLELGYYYEVYPKDAIYHIIMTVPHTGELATFNFSASGLAALTDESWGLDNVSVVPLGLNTIYMPVIGN